MNAPSDDDRRQKASLVSTNRKRYEELQAAAQHVKPLMLPPPTLRDGAPIDEASILHREVIPGGWYWTTTLRQGVGLRLLNSCANAGVSLFAWNKADTSERYNSADTVKIQWTSELRKGRVLFSDMGRVMLSIVEDSCCAHDTIVGGSTPASNARNFGDPTLRSTRENLILAASKHGLGVSDIAPVVTFFAPVFVDEQGKLAWREGAVTTGDFVDLRAEMDLLIALSNCPHPLAPVSMFDPGSMEAIVFKLPEAAGDDLCRKASAEAARGFENNGISS